MTSTTHASFGTATEALEVASSFAGHIQGKTILVTGVNLKGIGFTTAEAFASQDPARLILGGRSPDKVQETIDALKPRFPHVDYRFLQLDLASQKAVRKAAAELLSWQDVPTVDIVVNSAGVMNLPERYLSEDGIEMHFATNHIGHFLFTNLIMPKLIKAAEKNPKGATRIVNVTSLSPTRAGIRWSDINFDQVSQDLPENERPDYDRIRAWGAVEQPETLKYFPILGYDQSKAANVLFSIGATERLYEKYGILSIAVHPGVIVTELSRSAPPNMVAAIKSMRDTGVIKYQTLGSGSSTGLVAALDPKLGKPEAKNGKENWGVYLIDCQITDKADPRAESTANASRLWQISEEMVGQKFEWN